MSRGYVGVYWGPRPESVISCADAIARFLTEIGEESPSLRSWYRRSSRKQQPLAPIAIASESIAAELKSAHRDSDKTVMAELGFSFGAWNGDVLGVSCQIGCTDPRLPNSVVVGSDDGLSEDLAQTILRIASKCFRPDSTRVELGGT